MIGPDWVGARKSSPAPFRLSSDSTGKTFSLSKTLTLHPAQTKILACLVRPTTPSVGGHSPTRGGGEPPGKANSVHEADLLERVHGQNWLTLEFYTVLNMLGSSVTRALNAALEG